MALPAAAAAAVAAAVAGPATAPGGGSRLPSGRALPARPLPLLLLEAESEEAVRDASAARARCASAHTSSIDRLPPAIPLLALLLAALAPLWPQRLLLTAAPLPPPAAAGDGGAGAPLAATAAAAAAAAGPRRTTGELRCAVELLLGPASPAAAALALPGVGGTAAMAGGCSAPSQRLAGLLRGSWAGGRFVPASLVGERHRGRVGGAGGEQHVKGGSELLTCHPGGRAP